MTEVVNLVCPYCGGQAEFFETSESIYGGCDYGPVYVCLPCDARVGCHRQTKEPLGRLADAPTRKARMKAHAAFDPLWRERKQRRFSKRSRAYEWLAMRIGIDIDSCHIGQFDVETCNKVIKICQERKAQR